MTISALIECARPNFTSLGECDRTQLRECLIKCFYSAKSFGSAAAADAYLASETGQRDLDNHIEHRMAEFRSTLIPWLIQRCGLTGRSVLEVGFGTGSSTVALAEQGVHVPGIDLEERAPEVAKLRCELHGVADRVDLHIANAIEMHRFAPADVSMVIFFAVLEHMTIEERLTALKCAWDLLAGGDNRYVVVVETPNRLWYHDPHTSLLNFFHWLPDELAVRYAGHSPRGAFTSAFQAPAQIDSGTLLRLARWGRGVSYHEFELALGPLDRLGAIEGMFEFLRSVDLGYQKHWMASRDEKYHELLLSIEPRLPAAFREQWLTLFIKR